MNTTPIRNVDLQAMAKQAMLENGFEPEFPPQVQQQLGELKVHPPQVVPGANIRDLRNLVWSSINNDTSRDLDQIEIAERLPDGETKILVGIADVDTFAPKSSAIDAHAGKDVLADAGWVREFDQRPEKGRPSEKWQINPKVTQNAK